MPRQSPIPPSDPYGRFLHDVAHTPCDQCGRRFAPFDAALSESRQLGGTLPLDSLEQGHGGGLIDTAKARGEIEESLDQYCDCESIGDTPGDLILAFKRFCISQRFFCHGTSILHYASKETT